jgi:glycosyltransferase involved in cell wall biosynthesis
MNKELIELSIILPVHNESAGIEKFIYYLVDCIDKLKISYEIIAVENGSTDNSLEILKSLTQKVKTLKFITSEIGWGNALRRGINIARGNMCCLMVSDGQIDPKYIIQLYDIYKHNKIYTLYKVYRTNRENLIRKINSYCFNIISRVVFGIKSKDINATPKLIDTKLLKSLKLTATNIAIDLELLIELKKLGLNWLEIPAESRIRAGGKSTTKLATVIEMVKWISKMSSPT